MRGEGTPFARIKNGMKALIEFPRTGKHQSKALIDLRKKEKKWQTLFQILPVGVSIIDANNNVVEFNAKLGEILHISKKGLEEKSYLHRKYLRSDGTPISREELPSAIAIHEQRSASAELCVVKEDGEKIWLNVSAAPLPFPDARAVVVTTDITDQKKAADELLRAKESVEIARHQLEAALAREQMLARTDALTGINNRRQLFDLAGQLFQVSKRYKHSLSMFIFDIDHFKNVNDRFGHQFGDEVLRSIAQIANHELRKSDIFGRYGGEEFMAILPNTKVHEARKLAERIRKKIEAHHLETPKAMPHPVSVSFGIARMLTDDDSLDEMISRADRALYRAKRAGRNRVVIF